jgi:preprotein translocase subunit SecG
MSKFLLLAILFSCILLLLGLLLKLTVFRRKGLSFGNRNPWRASSSFTKNRKVGNRQVKHIIWVILLFFLLLLLFSLGSEGNDTMLPIIYEHISKWIDDALS